MLTEALISAILTIISPNALNYESPQAIPPIFEPHILGPEEIKFLNDCRELKRAKDFLDIVYPEDAPHSYEDARIWKDLV